MKNKINLDLISDKEIFETLKKEYLNIKPVGCEDFFKRRKNSPSLPYLRKRFGVTFNQILIKAGIEESELNFVRRKRKDYVKMIKKLNEQLGHTPTAIEFSNCGYSIGPLQKEFGSFNNAILESGLNPNQYQTKVNASKEVLLKIYKKLSYKIGKPATTGDLNCSLETYNSGAFSIRFGGMRSLKKLAGFTEPSKGDIPHYSKKNILEILIKECYKSGRHLTITEIKENDNITCCSTILKYFQTTKFSNVWAEVDEAIAKREVLTKGYIQ